MARAASDRLSVSSRHLAERLGGRIRERRLALGLTLVQTAAAADVSVSHLSSIETGANLPSLPILARIAAVLELALQDVLREVGGSGGSIQVGRLDEREAGLQRLSDAELQLQVVALGAGPGEQGGCPLATEAYGIFVLVLTGALEVTIDEAVTLLGAGDSLDADLPRHVAWKVVGETRCRSVWAHGPARAS